MKQVSMWQAEDGTQYASAADAYARDLMLNEVSNIASTLPERPESFGEHRNGYIQHEPATVLWAQRAIAKIALRRFPGDRHVQFAIDADMPAGDSFLGRILSDTEDLSPLNKVWWRISCIDDKWREWEQPYYTRHTPIDPQPVNGT